MGNSSSNMASSAPGSDQMGAEILSMREEVGDITGMCKKVGVAVAMVGATAAFLVNPVLGHVLIPLVVGLIALFATKPTVHNDTMREILEAIQRQEQGRQEQALQRREAQAEERAQESHRREEVVRQREKAAKQRERAALSAALQIEGAAKRREEAAIAEAQKAIKAHHQGIRPVVMPTREQFSAAKDRIRYNPEKLHFAVCGASGSGKSSLINAVRGLGNKDPDAAPVGVTECTTKVTRYPDPRDEVPYSRFVWYDIPGAGTMKVPDWQYFNDQGLFVFDFIVMVYDVRFTRIDVCIIENCYRFNIPVFIVRSKADQHINNMMQEQSNSQRGDEDYDRVYRETAEKYIKATRSDFDRNLELMADSSHIDARDRQMLLHQRVYIVSGLTLRSLLQTASGKKARAVDKNKIIDEAVLVEDMLIAAAQRRYSKPADG